MAYIFDGNTGKTYDDIKKRRDLAKQFSRGATGVPKTTMEGIHAVADALISRHNTKKADRLQGDLVKRLGADNPIVRSLMGVPQYARGTGFHPGGPAIVGEKGPELAWMPPGAQVVPNEATEDEGFMSEFLTLSPEERARVLQQMQEGTAPHEAIQPPDYKPEEMFDRGSQLDMERAYQTADSGQIATDALPYGDMKLTEGQSKDINYFRRGFSANQDLSDPKMEQALLQFTDNFAGNFGGVGRLFQDEDYQKANRAANEFLAMVLRKDTGAAVTAEEFKMYGPLYIPMPGDKPGVIEAKRNARAQFLKGMEMGGGNAAPLYGAAKSELSGMSDADLLKLLQGGQ